MRRASVRPVLRGLAAVAMAAGIAFGVAACGGDDSGDSGGAQTTGTTGGEATRGGVFRGETTDFGFTDAFDPTGEYLGWGWSLFSGLTSRTLVGYPHTGGPSGNELVPDIATEVPEPTNGGKTYTFTLRDGVTFGPPVDRAVTSEDIAYGFERIANPDLAAGYGFYYQQIQGFQAFADGEAQTISGIKTPDPKTISFTLTEPVGDFLFRMAMPAAAPIPEEVGKCFTQAGEYGRYVISTGPYMIAGSPELDIQSCATMKPISGFNPNRFLNFVRNPGYDPATDTEGAREANVDRVEWVINTNQSDIFDRIEAGEVDGTTETPPPDVLRKYSRDEQLKDNLHVDAGDRTWYIFMNLTEPPFDDVNVRKAANFVMDKDGLRRAWGGRTAGEIATKTVPNSLYNGAFDNADYDPYPSPDSAGDVEAAKEAMRQSKYDTDQDGICDAPACKGVFFVNRNSPPQSTMQPVIDESLRKIGITLESRELPVGPAYNLTQQPSRQVAMGANHGWGKDYSDPSTFAVLQDGRTIIPANNSNVSLVGITQAQASELDTRFPAGGVPNVEADIDACNRLLDQERQDCWIAFDKKVMEEVVPWVPYLDSTNISIVSDAVTKYEYDQFATEIGIVNVGVDPEQQR